MKKVLITGANSYIGMSFESYIKQQFSAEYEIDTVDMIDGSWREKDFSGYDAIFHVAGIAHQKETRENAELYYRVNRDLAIETAIKAKNEGVGQFVFLSSMSVYGKETGVITRSTEPTPKTNYGKSKLQAEQQILPLADEHFRVAVLRPPMVYGNGCRGNYNALARFALKLPLFPRVNNQRSMVYIENLCEFVRLVLDENDSGIYCPQNAEYVNTTRMAECICKANGKRFRSTRMMNWAIAIAKKLMSSFEKAFGSLTYDMQLSAYRKNYSLVDFSESIERTEANKAPK